jgi:hypothetical protein
MAWPIFKLILKLLTSNTIFDDRWYTTIFASLCRKHRCCSASESSDWHFGSAFPVTSLTRVLSFTPRRTSKLDPSSLSNPASKPQLSELPPSDLSSRISPASLYLSCLLWTRAVLLILCAPPVCRSCLHWIRAVLQVLRVHHSFPSSHRWIQEATFLL